MAGIGLVAGLSLGDRRQDGLDVEDRSSVDRFKVADKDAAAFDRDELDGVQADRVGTVG
jgi:hypothetical protein